MRKALARRLVRYTAVGCLGAFALVGTACLPLPKGVTLTTTGGTGSTCPTGTWHLAAETVTQSIQTPLGPATITTGGTGLTITINATKTWSFKGNQTLHITGSNINATASVNPTASGTDTVSTNNITFTLNTVGGTVAATGTAFGHAFSINWPLGQSDAIQNLYGLSGTATFSCTGATLSLSLPTAHTHMQFHQGEDQNQNQNPGSDGPEGSDD